MEEGKSIKIPAGHSGVVPVRVIPKTSIRLAAPSQEVTALRASITLQGPVENLPDGTPVSFSWLVKRGAETTAHPVPNLKLKVQSKTQGSVTVPLDAVEHRLIGQGSVGFEIAPDFPRCPVQRAAPGALTFDNPLSITFAEALSNRRIGSVLTVRPSIDGAFSDAVVLLTLRERDAGEGERTSDEDMAHEIRWEKGDTSSRKWRVGCAGAEGGVVLDYPEANEVGDYEIEYTLSVSTDGGKKFQTLVESGQILTVPRPKLESFELLHESSTVLESGLFDYLSMVYKNMTRSDAAQIPLKILRARGKLSGFDPGLPLPLQISLWMTDAEGKIAQFKATGATAGLEHTITLSGDGSFNEKLCDVCELDHEEDWAKFKSSKFFAVLRLPASVGGGAERVPIQQVFDYDSAKLAPFHDGEMTSVLRGTGVSTAPASGAEIRPTGTGQCATLYAKHEGLLSGVKIDLDATKKAALEKFKAGWTANKARYDTVAKEADVPAALVAALHWRESSANFGTYLHQGDPLGKPPVHWPTDIPTFHKWEDAAVHALGLKRSKAAELAMTYVSKDIVKMATYAELYNGLGYHNKSLTSPYVYSGTNRYTKGKYVKDGVFDPDFVDAQLGVVALVEGIRGM